MDKIIKDVWNSDFAYGVGLITTDGCLSPDKRHIEFSSKDLELVTSFKKCFNLTNKICKKSRGGFPRKLYHRVQFGNVHLYKFLMSIGLSSRKSKIIKALQIPDSIFADFLRGVIDGDGSIGYFMHPESKKKQFRIRIASASKIFLEWLRIKLRVILKTKGSIKKYPRCYELCYYKADSLKIANFIYYRKNLRSLKRKQNIASLIKCESGETGTRASLRSW